LTEALELADHVLVDLIVATDDYPLNLIVNHFELYPEPARELLKNPVELILYQLLDLQQPVLFEVKVHELVDALDHQQVLALLREVAEVDQVVERLRELPELPREVEPLLDGHPCRELALNVAELL